MAVNSWLLACAVFFLVITPYASASSALSIDVDKAGNTFIRKSDYAFYVFNAYSQVEWNVSSTVKIFYVGDVTKTSAWEYVVGGREFVKSNVPVVVMGSSVCARDYVDTKYAGTLVSEDFYSDCVYYKPQYLNLSFVEEDDNGKNVSGFSLVNQVNITLLSDFEYRVDWGAVDYLGRTYEPLISNLTVGLVSYWQFNGTWNDSHGGNNLTTTGNNPVATDNGRVGGAYDYDGSHYISETDEASLRLSTFTITAWLNQTDTPDGSGNAYVLHKDEYRIRTMQSGVSNKPAIYLKTSGGNAWYSCDSDYTLNVWMHLAFVVNDTSLICYRDGVEDGVTALAGTVNTGADDFKVGGDGGDDWHGIIDELAVWGVALNASQIMNLSQGYTYPFDYEIIQTEYYVSTSGDDSNDGSSGSPIKSISKLNSISLNPNDFVYFNRGDEWNFVNDTFIDLVSGDSSGYVTYSAYGDGDKPLFKATNYTQDASCWDEIQSNVWEYNCSLSLDVGNLIMNGSNNFGVRNWSITQLSVMGQGSYTFNDSTNNLYLYSTANPISMYGEIEIVMGLTFFDINGISYNVYDNLSMTMGGRHGVEGQNTHHINITNNELSFIGGEWQNTGVTRYGNAIQCYQDCHDFIVENNKVWEVYDAALTAQGASGTWRIYNATFRNNLVWNSAYCAEYFVNDDSSDADNIVFDSNTCWNIGAGWYNPQRSNAMDGVCFRSGRSEGFNTRGINFTNNICHTTNEWVTEDYMVRVNAPFKGWRDNDNLSIDYNLYYNFNDYIALWGDLGWTKYATLAAYQAATGKDLNSTVANPLFVSNDSSNPNFLVPYNNSPACGGASDGGDIGALPCAASGAPIPYNAPPPILYAWNLSVGNDTAMINITSNASMVWCSANITTSWVYNQTQPSCTLEFKGLSPSTTYNYSVRVNNTLGNRTKWDNLTFTTNANLPETITVTLQSLLALNSTFGNARDWETASLEEIEHMEINFSINTSGTIDSWYFNFTANGTGACSLGNEQYAACYMYPRWIQYINGTTTTTFDAQNQHAGDRIELIESGTSNAIDISLRIDEHYNPNVFKHYGALYNFSDVKWQEGTSQRITKKVMIKIEVNNTNVPREADWFKLDGRFNHTGNPAELDIYACNSSYIAGHPNNVPECTLIGQEAYQDFQDDGTKTRIITKNNILGELINIRYLIYDTTTNAASSYYAMKTYKIEADNYTQKWEYTTDDGGSWANAGDGYESEVNINWFFTQNTTQFLYRLYANTTSGEQTIFSGNMTWDLTAEIDYPPLSDIANPQDNETISLPYTMNITSKDANNDRINTTLQLYQNGTRSKNIVTNMNESNHTYYWNDATPNGRYNLTILTCETETAELFCHNHNIEINLLTIPPPYNDTTPPNISLQLPVVAANFTTGFIGFQWYVMDNSSVDVCRLIRNGSVIATNDSITVNQSSTLEYDFTANGTFSWQVSCNDSNGNWGMSVENRSLIINESARLVAYSSPNITGLGSLFVFNASAGLWVGANESVNATFRLANSTNVTVFINSSIANYLTIEVIELANGTFYFWNVTVCDVEYNCTESETQNFTTFVGGEWDAPNLNCSVLYYATEWAEYNCTATDANSPVTYDFAIKLNSTKEAIPQFDTRTGGLRKFLGLQPARRYEVEINATDALGNVNTTTYYFTTWAGGESMIIAAIILIPILLGVFCLVGAISLSDEHTALKIGLFLMSFVTFFGSLWFGGIAVVEVYDMPALQDVIGTTVFWMAILFFMLVSYFMIYMIYVSMKAAAQEKKNKLEY